MRITQSSYEGRRQFELVLSRDDFDDICSGFPDGGFILGRYHDVHFYIFDGNRFSDAWKPLDDGYFINIGVKAPIPQPGATPQEWDRASQLFYNNLERAINESGRIPIENEMVLAGELKKINLGYVVMHVDPI